MKADIHRVLEFQKLLDAFTRIDRRIHRKHEGEYVRENDTEHSYNLAMTAWFLSQWFNELDRDKVIRYALLHDLVEVHAGDTYLFGAKADLETKHTREAAALKKLEAEWSDFADMIGGITSYEQRSDPEARFVYALDKLMPIFMIYANDGYTWRKEGITVDMLYIAKLEKVKLSPEILPYFEQLHELLLARPDIIRAE